MSQTIHRSPGWHRIALAISIVVNLFLVALIGGHLLLGRTGGQPAPDTWAQVLASMEANLPPRDAAAFRQVLLDNAPKYAAAQQRLIAARRQYEQQVIAEPFDPAAVRQSFAKWRTAFNEFFDLFNGPLVDALAKISPEGRRKLPRLRPQENLPVSQSG
jgi:uncharacterized membrane protein